MRVIPTVTDVDLAIQACINDPATSYWLRHALEVATNRDAVDALLDARALAFFLNERHAAVMEDARIEAEHAAARYKAAHHPCPFCSGWTADHSKCTCNRSQS